MINELEKTWKQGVKKEPVVLFTVADNKNMPAAQMFINSVRKFHTEAELPIVIVGEEDVKEFNDPHFFYRATPIIGERLLNMYDLVLKADCDQICFGDLNHIIHDKFSWDVGTVLNINRVDPQMYGLVSCYTIPPQEYYNCGFVAMRNPDFVSHWKKLCFSPDFLKQRFREQDLLNIICRFGEYTVKCLDHYDSFSGHQTWNGLVAKGEGLNMKMKDGRVLLPQGKDNYPDRDVIVKLYHFAGGNNEAKMNYRTHFNEDMINYIDWLVSPEGAKI